MHPHFDDSEVPEILRVTPPPERAARIPGWRAWAQDGLPCSPVQAQARIIASRQSRRPSKGSVSLTVTVPADLLEAFDAFVERWGVTRSLAVRSFIERALREYGTSSDAEAGL